MKVLLFFLVSSSVFASEAVALQKIKEFGKILKKELVSGMKESPIKAVEVCNIKAPQIQRKVSTNKMKIGRVSLKTRNQKNTPKKWMKEYIDQFHKKEIRKPYVTVKLSDGKTGLLKPIKTMPLCLKCHGSNVDQNLYKVIKSKYPNDEAIGYKAGEIRGFFWAEF